jgi:RNA polymerase sigma-70 factor (ECF subfamily)
MSTNASRRKTLRISSGIAAASGAHDSSFPSQEYPAGSSVTTAGTPGGGEGLHRRRASFQFESFNGEYLRRLVDGDRATEDHFFRYFSELLRIKLRARFRDPALIEDLRQETLLRVFTAIKHASSLRNPESLGSFVNSVCNNLVRETYRRNAKERTVELGRYDATDEHGSAEAMLVTEERRREVRRILNVLSERDREILRHVFFEDAGREAFCRTSHVGRGYLRVLLYRAAGRFRDRLLCAERKPTASESDVK